jgi:hypothetical protein
MVALLWTNDQPTADTPTWQHTTLTRDRHPYCLAAFKIQAATDPCLRPRGHWGQHGMMIVRNILESMYKEPVTAQSDDFPGHLSEETVKIMTTTIRTAGFN